MKNVFGLVNVILCLKKKKGSWYIVKIVYEATQSHLEQLSSALIVCERTPEYDFILHSLWVTGDWSFW